MLTFTKALEVGSGDPITSTQHNKLARAINDRCRAFQMVPWRVVMWWFNLFRQVRNPAEGGFVFPPQAEYFDIYQHLDSEHHQGTTWPVAGPGEFEGANLANPMMAFVFGNPGLDKEDERLSARIDLLPPVNLPPIESVWEMGKKHRGVYDPDVFAQNAPALDAARDFIRIVQPWFSPHGKSYGGFFPTPVELLTDCGATEDLGLGQPSYEILFSALRSDVVVPAHHGTLSTVDGKSVVTYAGSCPCGTTSHASGHVIRIVEFEGNYYVVVGTGTGVCDFNVDVFPTVDWIEGPYTGDGVLQHADGQHLARALWAFGVDFRGTPAQRSPDDFDVEKIAFDNEEFFNRQYYLAPNIGVLQGESLFVLYPRAEFGGSFVPDGSLGRFTGGETEHTYRAGFVLAGMFAKAKNLAEPVSIEVLDGAKVIATLKLTPDANGAAEAMRWLAKCPTPAPLTVRLATPARFSGVGSISVEFTEQLEYKPQPWDAYLVTRLAATAGGTAFGGGVDGRGRDCDFSREISKEFFANGCVVNRAGVAAVRTIAEWVNDQPVYDAARRLSRDHARIVRRQNLVSYEVTGGKSVLRFKRFAYGLNNIRADMFQDIAPPLDPVASGELIEGETYIVRATGNGKIAYAGGLYENDQTFVGVGQASSLSGPARREYQATGDAQAFVHDGIRHAALKKGFTNEWVMFLEAKRYHPSATSIWKPDAYSDYFAWCQRCHFYSGTAPSALRRHVSYNHTTDLDSVTFMPILNPMSVQTEFLAPEAPDQYNYTLNANRLFGSDNFYSSCQVYAAPYEIESCVVEDWAADQVIKVTFKDRLRAHPDAPAAVNSDPSTWSASEVQVLRNEYVTDPDVNEDYRTDDNTVREYVLHQADPTKQCTVKTGDSGTGSAVDGLTDNPFGCCYPHFFFCHLVPEVYEDGNDVMESHDTRAVIDSMLQTEVYLRAMCEGFVDGRTSKEVICNTPGHLGGLYDYRFENLCFDAFGGREIGCFPLAQRVDASGFGPLPNSLMYGEVFTRLAKAANLLDKLRLDVPIVFKYRTFEYRDDHAVSLTELDGTNCTTTGTCRAYGDGLGVPEATTLNFGSPSAWGTWVSIGALKAGQLVGCPYQMASVRTDTEYRAEIDPAFWNAVPTAVLDLVNLGSTGFLAIKFTSIENERREIVADVDGDRCPTTPPGGPAHWFDGGGEYYRWVRNQLIETTECVLVTSGLLTAPAVLSSDYKIGRTGALPAGGFCGNVATSGVRLDLISEQAAFVIVPLT